MLGEEQVLQDVSPELSLVQVARAAGIYRWTGRLDYTKGAEVGEELPQYPREPSRRIFAGDARWVLLKKDNMRPENTIPVFIGQGIIHMIWTDELPEVGRKLNILETMLGIILKTGLHRITEVDENFRWVGESHFRIHIEIIGELSEELPIHQAMQMTA